MPACNELRREWDYPSSIPFNQVIRDEADSSGPRTGLLPQLQGDLLPVFSLQGAGSRDVEARLAHDNALFDAAVFCLGRINFLPTLTTEEHADPWGAYSINIFPARLAVCYSSSSSSSSSPSVARSSITVVQVLLNFLANTHSFLSDSVILSFQS
jgi:hypothetical protein